MFASIAVGTNPAGEAMSGDLYLGAYWGPRQEPLDQCADRLLACLGELSAADEVFSSWYETGRSRRDALARAVDPRSRDAILRQLEKGRNCRDLDRSIIEDLGFGVYLWNGRRAAQAVSLSITCGLYCPNPNLSNAVVLGFPEELGELARKERAVEVFRAVVAAWEPDTGGVISRASRESRSFQPGSVFVDWMVFLKGAAISESQLPPSASVVRVNDLGWIVVTQDEPVEAGNAKHLQNVRAVERALGIGPH